jgi:hypothetical protein
MAGALHQIKMVELPQAEKDMIMAGNLLRQQMAASSGP